LELSDPGFDFSILSEFRGRLIAGKAEERLLDQLLEVLKEHHLLKERSRQRTDSTQIWAAIRWINRLEKVGETLRAALNDLATIAPEWLKARIPASWYERYGARIEESRLPKDKKEQDELALQIGKDGRQLLEWAYEVGSSREIQENSAVEILRRVWIQEYYQQEDKISWRDSDNTPPGEERIHSPYDAEARYSEKRGEGWVGYKGHLTETCEEDTPHIIVQVETTPAPQPDFEVIPTIQQDLADKQILPDDHLMDQGYMNIRHVVAAERDYGIHIIGYPMGDSSWQAQEAMGFDLPHFAIDWHQKVVFCPLHHASRYWTAGKDSQGEPVTKVEFSAKDCGACPQRVHCTHSQTSGRRLSIRPQVEYEALQKLRQEVQSEAFKTKYRKRAGIEGTISQAVRAYNFRRARYIGLAKVHLQQVATAAAINLARVFAWLSGVPLAKTRISPLSSLALAIP
jgi:transposase